MATIPSNRGFHGYLAANFRSITTHVSVVPVPGAALLGMLGLSVAGIKLRNQIVETVSITQRFFLTDVWIFWYKRDE